ncbi:MAG: hypothetical protein LUO82_00230 [Methanomicrobiales archaeon]|nr:hypothetical protein [Methanomicrobiales archaeon]
MTSKFGHGFITNLILLSKHFGLPPSQAFYGAADHLDELVMPSQFAGTEVERLLEQLRKRVIWHQPGTMDKEDAKEVIRTLHLLAVALDQELGIKDADIGHYE